MVRTFFSIDFVIYDGDIQFLDSARVSIIGDHLAAVRPAMLRRIRQLQRLGGSHMYRAVKPVSHYALKTP